VTKFAIAALAVAAGIGLAARSQAPEVQRYLKIKKM
jgi:hypothetical protein